MTSTPNLPRGDSPTLALVHPTISEYLLQSKLNGAEWRGALSLSAYLRREEVLAKQDLTQNGGITFWILVDTALQGNPLDPSSGSGNRLPLASCDTYHKKALVWRDGKLQEVVCHGVGSVFCAPQLRKRGYAQRLMQEIGKVLRTYQATEERPSLFSVLYSDIGKKKFYADFGWEPFNSTHVSLPAEVPEHVSGLPTAQPLYAEDLAELCKIDKALIQKSLESRPKGSKTAVALIPDVETIQWHQAREEFVGTEIHGKAPKIKGAIVGEKGKRVWCYWTRVWYNEAVSQAKGNTLYILRLAVEDEGQGHDADIAALLLMAQREAQEWKMGEVMAWNPSSETLAAARWLDPTAKLIDRESESITSLQWYPPHDGPVTDEVEWLSNEKYGWC